MSSHLVPGHVSIAGDRNIMIGSAVNQSGLFFFFFSWRVSVLKSPQRAGGTVVRLQLWGHFKRGRQGGVDATGRYPTFLRYPHLLPLRRVAASPSRVHSPPFHPFQSQALPAAFPHTSKQPSGEIRLVETWGLQSTAKGMNHLESRSFNL